MKIALIANGSLPFSLKSEIEAHSQIIAVDGGLAHCQELNIIPDLIVGDFDSVSAETLDQYGSVSKIYLPREKDQTDLEVALQEAFDRGAETVTLYGAWGGRIDHSLTNALILFRYPGRVQLKTKHELVFAIEKELHWIAKPGQTLSLIPLGGPVEGITTSGLKWNLKEGKLDHNFIGISNICVDAHIFLSIQSGKLLCVLLEDL